MFRSAKISALNASARAQTAALAMGQPARVPLVLRLALGQATKQERPEDLLAYGQQLSSLGQVALEEYKFWAARVREQENYVERAQGWAGMATREAEYERGAYAAARAEKARALKAGRRAIRELAFMASRQDYRPGGAEDMARGALQAARWALRAALEELSSWKEDSASLLREAEQEVLQADGHLWDARQHLAALRDSLGEAEEELGATAQALIAWLELEAAEAAEVQGGGRGRKAPAPYLTRRQVRRERACVPDWSLEARSRKARASDRAFSSRKAG